MPHDPVCAFHGGWFAEEGCTCSDDCSACGGDCECEYPHGYDYEPPFETCTCPPDCWHKGYRA